MNLGMTELVIILVIVLVIFGPSKLPGLGKALGETIRGFKKGMTDSMSEPAEREAAKPAPNSDRPEALQARDIDPESANGQTAQEPTKTKQNT